jgi:polyisoprenoid-binding protein YceI
MFSPKSFLAAAAALALTLPAAAQAPELSAPQASAQAWTVDKAQSRLGFTSKSDGQPFVGKFNQWDAQIAFDPANLGASSATVTIPLASVETDDPAKADSLKGDPWFATALFPSATFKTGTIRAEGSGYVADGTLTIRDKTQNVSLPFDLVIEGDVARMKGALTINRKDYGLGVGGWEDSHVDANVTIGVAVTAKKAG